ncbi:hypothetical protein QE197_17845 [Arsenophonus nasoniae]|uniref:Putative fimbrial protein n=1 Tax=Arsenophonus nasoniae TaxID=638 RepID=D2TWJ1_9GAMM|nr:hypothetical protein [Arsenophonus nasoniae]QBY45433.1 hypothetical protein ArsFIN_40320 [Arsenophonus nasoniae]WGM05577.1 hypothetical protein QE258_19220 [Arsenophonus nasoniae]WGM10589.1 hypothetical protein QE197_17845 [Arsenophonus nasoniae]WGM15297.1 hypothetical protein QE193_17730 [Arsenophonus nasoniae]CBA71745.1 putative fimbrial protein [Arsenophonus nasoniae]
MKKLSLIMLLTYTFGYTTSVFAQCIEIGGQIKVNGRDIIVTDDMPVGTLLDTFTTDSIKTYQCSNVKNMTTGGRAYGEFATDIDGMRVYKTNIAGIGYALGINSMCGKMLFPSKGWINNLDATSTCWTSGRWDPITHKFAIRIYKIGPTGNGEVAMRRVGASNLFYDDTKSWAKENLVFLNSFKVTTIGNNNSGGQGSNNGGGQANNNSGGQGSNNGGGQANNNSGGHGSNNGGEQGNNNWNGQDNRNRGSQGNNNGGGQGGNQNNNNSVWPNGDLNNNSVWPNGSVNNNVNNNSHRNDHN